MDLRELTPALLDLHVAHLREHVAESGKGETPVFMPPKPPLPDLEQRFRLEVALQRTLEDDGWLRGFVIVDGGRVVAHVHLRASALPFARHRCVLSMGVLAARRRRGLGRALVTHALAWARERGLAWVDLQVFANNAPATALYRSLGFVETGRIADQLRFGGQRFEDVWMAKRLG